MPELSMKERPEKSSTTSAGPCSTRGPRTPVNSGAVAMSSSPVKMTTVSPSRPTTLAEKPSAEVLMVDRSYPDPPGCEMALEPAATGSSPQRGPSGFDRPGTG